MYRARPPQDPRNAAEGSKLDGVVYRQCEAADLPGVRRLLLQLQEHAFAEELPSAHRLAELFGEMVGKTGVYWNLVAVAPAGVIGFLSLVTYRTLFHAGGTALINELVVDGSWRVKGIGRSLLRRAISEALTRGMDEIEVGTECANAGARAFYAACGFDQEYVLLGKELPVSCPEQSA